MPYDQNTPETGTGVRSCGVTLFVFGPILFAAGVGGHSDVLALTGGLSFFVGMVLLGVTHDTGDMPTAPKPPTHDTTPVASTPVAKPHAPEPVPVVPVVGPWGAIALYNEACAAEAEYENTSGWSVEDAVFAFFTLGIYLLVMSVIRSGAVEQAEAEMLRARAAALAAINASPENAAAVRAMCSRPTEQTSSFWFVWWGG